MHFVPKISVRGQLTLTILLAILISWVCGTGVGNYLTFRQLGEYREVMLAHPDQYPQPIPKQQFGLREFLLGYPPRLPQSLNQPPPPPSGTGSQQLAPEQIVQQRTALGVTAFIVLGITLLAGAWASSRFTHPLSTLMKGVEAIGEGDFENRLSLKGEGEFAQLASTLNQMSTRVSAHIAQLEHEAEMRRHFMADIAHEFRTPITTLKTMAAALEDGVADDPERRRRAAQSIIRTSDRLLRLVTDMLDLAKLDLHELPLHRQPVDVRELAASCVQAQADHARAARIILHPVEPGPPIMADVDPDRLAQTVDNLLTNAISYAGEQAEVSVSFEGTSPTRIIVADTGRGIPAKHLPFICEPFYRVDAVRNPGEQHSGLGLRIAKALVEAHGGQLSIESTEGKGTRAIISLS